MLYCEGSKAYGYAKDFVLPAKTWPSTNIYGTPSVSVEFWMFMAGASKVNLHTPFTVGDSDIAGGWCDPGNIHPIYCIGKLLMRVTGGLWVAEMSAGTGGTPGIVGGYSTLLSQYYYKWVHIAMTSDGECFEWCVCGCERDREGENCVYVFIYVWMWQRERERKRERQKHRGVCSSFFVSPVFSHPPSSCWCRAYCPCLSVSCLYSLSCTFVLHLHSPFVLSQVLRSAPLARQSCTLMASRWAPQQQAGPSAPCAVSTCEYKRHSRESHNRERQRCGFEER